MGLTNLLCKHWIKKEVFSHSVDSMLNSKTRRFQTLVCYRCGHTILKYKG